MEIGKVFRESPTFNIEMRKVFAREKLYSACADPLVSPAICQPEESSGLWRT